MKPSFRKAFLCPGDPEFDPEFDLEEELDRVDAAAEAREDMHRLES